MVVIADDEALVDIWEFVEDVIEDVPVVESVVEEVEVEDIAVELPNVVVVEDADIAVVVGLLVEDVSILVVEPDVGIADVTGTEEVVCGVVNESVEVCIEEEGV